MSKILKPLAEVLEDHKTRSTMLRKFIDFTPDCGSIIFNNQQTGVNLEQELKTELDLGWHAILCSSKNVRFVDDNLKDSEVVILVADKPTDMEIKLYGLKGWDNVKEVLKTYGEELYGSKQLKAKGGALTRDMFVQQLPKELKETTKPYFLSGRDKMNNFLEVFYAEGNIPKSKIIHSSNKEVNSISRSIKLSVRPIVYLPSNILVDMNNYRENGNSKEMAIKIMIPVKTRIA